MLLRLTSVVYPFLPLLLAQITIPEVLSEATLFQVLKDTRYQPTACERACAVIANRFPRSVFVGRTGNFEFWDAKQAELSPACRLEPISAPQLSWALGQIIEHGCHFAIKSGGHERTPGASNADGGITIDLVRFNHVRLSQDKGAVSLGAGLRWSEVYEALERDQLMVLGGRIADVGIGGLLLGEGGISFFSNERGLACDSVIEYDVVLPNTTILTVNKSSWPELYRALRGAGASNFGIVTSFTLETFPLASHTGIWTAQKVYPWEDIPELLQAHYRTITESMDADPGVAVMNIFGCQTRHRVCHAAVQLQHTTHQTVDRWPRSFEVYNQIRGLPQTVLVNISLVSTIALSLAGSSPAGRYRTIYGTISYSPSTVLETQILQIFREEVDSISTISGFMPGIIMHPLSRTMIVQMRKNGGNAMHGLHTRKEPLIICNVSWQWLEQTDDKKAYVAYQRLISRAETAAKELGVWNPYKYVNYAEASQDVWRGYGDESVIRLTNLQNQVDLRGIFARDGLAGGPFKLGDLQKTLETVRKLTTKDEL